MEELNLNVDLGKAISTLDPKCTGFPNFHDPETCAAQTIGSFEFEVRYDAKYVSVTVEPGSLCSKSEGVLTDA